MFHSTGDIYILDITTQLCICFSLIVLIQAQFYRLLKILTHWLSLTFFQIELASVASKTEHNADH